jgi:hypothetical protein
MRTKTLLLSAAALLAAGFVSSQAQPVYSQNIVGYASVATPASGTYYMLTIPFAIGVSNGANEIWPVVSGTPSLPDYSSLLLWNAGSQSFVTYVSDSTSPSGWDDTSYNNLAAAPVVPVGQGFFLNLSAANVTNTFAGTVAVNIGTSNKMVLPSSGTYYMVGSTVPYAGAVTNGTSSGGGVNLNGLPDYSSLLTWNPKTQTFVTYVSDSSSPSGWDDTSYNNLSAPPTITVGQGFFINLTGSYTWTVGL